jgi:Ca2+-binding RTX toxin-like protein
VLAGDGNDSLFGEAGDDSIQGDGGDDSLDGGDGSDSLYGGIGNDSLTGGAGGDRIEGGDDADTIVGGAGDTIFGGEGGADSDTLVLNFADLQSVSLGADGESGTVTFIGGGTLTFSGIEQLRSTGAIEGTAGNDVIGAGYIDAEGDQIDGTDGANDVVGGFGGDDSISTGSGADLAYGGTGNDTLAGGIGNDTLSGDEGDDRLTGGTGDDALSGGSGADTATFTGAVADYSFARGPNGELIVTDGVAGRDGTDTLSNVEYVSFNGVTYRVMTGDEADNQTLQGPDDGTPVLVVAYGGADWGGGHATNDLMFGGDGTDTLDGGDGSDTLSGDAGDDLLRGDGGNDSLSGGAGDDNLEGGAGADTLSGGDGTDNLFGGTDNDSLDGGGGDDWLEGGAGEDTLSGGDGSDWIYATDGDGNDTVIGGEDADDSDQDTLLVDRASGVNVIFTGDESGIALGAVAAEGSVSFSEIEAIYTGSGNDTIDASATSSGTWASGWTGDDTLIGGSGDDTLFGDAGNDSLSGGTGSDSLDGGIGADTLTGGRGADTLTGGAGNDVLDFDRGSGSDTVSDFDMTVANGQTADQLDVSDLRNPDGSPIRWADVTVGDDGNGNAVLTFPEGEQITLLGVDPGTIDKQTAASMGMPCLAEGTLIDTPQGRRPVQDLRAGDLVLTERGAEPVLWAGGRRIGPEEMAARPVLQPVVIRRGALGNDRPLFVSRQHGLAVLGPQGAVLARAGQLAGLGQGAFRQACGRRTVAYHHLLLARHALIRANGAWAETLWPGPAALAALGPEVRGQIALALPRLAPALAVPGLLPQLFGPRALPGIALRDLRRLNGIALADVAKSAEPVVAG